jgi:NDP-sugar pyrophosphorylase family protein
MDGAIIILAGGASSRMKHPVAGVDPRVAAEALSRAKAMIGVGEDGRPFLDYLLNNVEEAGYAHAVIVVGERDTSITDYYERAGKSRRFPGLRLSYVPQRVPQGRDRPLGTSDAVLQAFNAIPALRGGGVTVCNSDNLYSVQALRLMLEDTHEHAMIAYDRSALRFPEERISRFAVISRDHEGFLTGIIEKPAPGRVEESRDAQGIIAVSMNIWRFTVDTIAPFLAATPLHPQRQERELPMSVQLLVKQRPQSVFTIARAEHVIDMTSQGDVTSVREYLKNAFPPFRKHS